MVRDGRTILLHQAFTTYSRRWFICG